MLVACTAQVLRTGRHQGHSPQGQEGGRRDLAYRAGSGRLHAVVQAAMGRAGGAGFRGPANPKRPKAHPEHRHRPRPWPDAYAFRGVAQQCRVKFQWQSTDARPVVAGWFYLSCHLAVICSHASGFTRLMGRFNLRTRIASSTDKSLILRIASRVMPAVCGDITTFSSASNGFCA